MINSKQTAIILFSLMALSAFPASVGSQTSAPVSVRLGLPLACEIGRTCEIQNYVDRDPSSASKDYQCGTASYNDHSGVDFRLLDMVAQRRGVNVLAAAAGRVSRVRDGIADVSVRSIDRQTIEGRECGNGVVIDHGGGLTTQYCHMRNGSIIVRPGAQVGAGAPLGQVGLSGNTEYPHLHFTVRRGETVTDPFAPLPGTDRQCGAGEGMWQSNVARTLNYKAGAILNTGFSSTVLTMSDVEEGAIQAPNSNSPALIAYARAINLKAGDVQRLVLKGPNGAILASSVGDPLVSSQAQRFLFVGKRRPATGGWPRGQYVAEYVVIRSGQTILQRQFEMRL
jgi:Peptidase family M23